jgi:hypothetical protein
MPCSRNGRLSLKTISPTGYGTSNQAMGLPSVTQNRPSAKQTSRQNWPTGEALKDSHHEPMTWAVFMRSVERKKRPAQ